jgi:sporulation protein YlmC with PRC-barrel domain
MKLIRLQRHEHPAGPHHELRQHEVLDRSGRVVGEVANLYVDEDDRELQFVDVASGGFLGMGKKHHLVPAEAISEEGPGSITLDVDKETVERASTYPNPEVGPDDEYQRTIREHYD